MLAHFACCFKVFASTVVTPAYDFNYSFPDEVLLAYASKAAALLAWSSSTLISNALMTKGIVIKEMPNLTGIDAL